MECVASHMGVEQAARRDLDEVRRIVLGGLHGLKSEVYLFGSQARGDAHRASDIDVAVLPDEPLPLGVLSEIRESLDESSVPYTVEVIDLSQADASLGASVAKEGRPWTS